MDARDMYIGALNGCLAETVQVRKELEHWKQRALEAEAIVARHEAPAPRRRLLAWVRRRRKAACR